MSLACLTAFSHNLPVADLPDVTTSQVFSSLHPCFEEDLGRIQNLAHHFVVLWLACYWIFSYGSTQLSVTFSILLLISFF